jgi:ParB-like chromosome segregation protein Spo0J
MGEEVGRGMGRMNTTPDVLKVLEEYGRWKAEILSTYGLDSKEVTKLSGEIRDRLKRMRFKIQPR